MQASVVSTSPRTFRHKTVAALLAFLLGWAGAHWWYLGRPRPWIPLAFTALIVGVAALRPAPFFSQLWYYLILIPLTAGFVEALVLSLRSDAKFDARYNPGHTEKSRNGWGAVLIAIATLFIGMSIIMGHVVVASLEMAADTLRF
nr:TM2 domain-containing protein [Pseudomonas sp.]